MNQYELYNESGIEYDSKKISDVDFVYSVTWNQNFGSSVVTNPGYFIKVTFGVKQAVNYSIILKSDSKQVTTFRNVKKQSKVDKCFTN